jgi:DNA mismatch endonuclease (patch repair protein)
MTDVFDSPTRSQVMRAVKGKNTKPEQAVRSLLHSLGYRFRLHRRDLPGSPDIVFPGRKAAIFVHGCFWHSHTCSRGSRMPKANADYWAGKLARNKARDATARAALKALGWRVLTVWECEIMDVAKLEVTLRDFLAVGPAGRPGDS